MTPLLPAGPSQPQGFLSPRTVEEGGQEVVPVHFILYEKQSVLKIYTHQRGWILWVEIFKVVYGSDGPVNSATV